MPDYMILLNHTHSLPEGFEDTIELIAVKNCENDEFQIEKKAYEAFLRLRQDMLESEGLQIELNSVYRSVERQQRTWNKNLEKHGLEYTQKYVAIPGCSEHHTGFAVDISAVVDGKPLHGTPNHLAYDHLYKLVHKRLAKYGFILRYPEDKQHITKIGYEPWHIRYIDDPEIAQEITEKGICFEEYHQALRKPDYMILLNPTHRLPEGFEDTITLLNVENAAGEAYRVEEKAYEAFLRLREDLMENDGLQIELLSVYRDIPQQERTWARTLESRGEEYTRKYVAIPGHSEHHTGFALDVGFMLDGKLSHKNDDLFSYEPMYKVVQKKLPQYGFILRYPADKVAITTIGYEPWHFRYIDDPVIAQEITDKGICFEEYWATK